MDKDLTKPVQCTTCAAATARKVTAALTATETTGNVTSKRIMTIESLRQMEAKAGI